MHAALALILGLWLALAPPARAAPLPSAWSAEVEENLGRLILVWPAPTRATLTLAGEVAQLRAERPVAVPPASVTTPLAGWLLGAAANGDGSRLSLQLRPGTDTHLTQPHPRLTVIEFSKAPAPAVVAAPPSLALAAADGAAMVAPAAGPARTMPVPRSRPALDAPAPLPAIAATAIVVGDGAESTAESSPVPAGQVTVAATGGADALELRFRWGSTVPAAMFERAGQFWAVFPGGNAQVAGWRSLARPDVAAWLEPLATAAAGEARLFRFRIARPVRIEPRPSEDGWIVQVTAGEATSADAGSSPWVRDPERGELAAETAGQVAQVRDPESGERLTLLLAPEGGLRHALPARLVDLELLPSLQGLVWRPLSDGMIAAVTDGRLTVTRPGGLRLSTVATEEAVPVPEPAPSTVKQQLTAAAPEPDDGHAQAPEAVAATPPAPLKVTEPAVSGALELGGLAALDAAGRQLARARLLDELRGLAGPQRARARLELARLYLADALGPEARTALELIDDRELGTAVAGPMRTARIALTGAAEALAGRPDPALASLLDHALDADAEIALWRAYAAALGARWPLATQEWQRSGGLPQAYPGPLRRRLGLELAATLLDHGDAGEARALLRQLAGIGLSGTDGARLRLLEGIADAREGRLREAEAAFAAAAAAGEGDIATRARFLLASVRADAGSLEPAAAATALAGERQSWRGHPWEPRMLERLAELQAAAGRQVEAIATRREAIARTADPAAAAAAREALRVQVAAWLTDTGTPAVARLAIHRAHGDLLDGTGIADRLRALLGEAAARAGLTDTAAGLLDATAPGPETRAAQVALAEALAAQGKLKAAQRRLARVDSGGELDRELQARAAQTAGNPAQAAAALLGVGSASGRVLAREILALQGDWSELARRTGAELAAAGETAELDPSQAAAAVWFGLAQARLGRTDAAAAVAARYAERIRTPQLAGLLRLATMTAAGQDGDGTMAGRFAAALRGELAALGPVAAMSTGGGIRTASARSGPEG
jgi:hypothetical protein